VRLVRLICSRALAPVVLSLAIAACADLTTQPPMPPAAGRQVHPGLLGFEIPPGIFKKLLSCPTLVAQRTVAVIGPEGGTLAVPGASIAIPPDAVRDSTTFVLEMPVSLYAEVRIHPDGAEHYQFAQPVVISIGYGNCAPPLNLFGLLDNASSSLVGAYVDSDTYEVLELMPTLDDTDVHVIRFATDHLSSYIVAY
jgi:hypothetical protein